MWDKFIGQKENMLCFSGHAVSVTAAQLWTSGVGTGTVQNDSTHKI